jgi:protein-S-isoprenylcysteine O-methyltransferase Ste14
MAGRQDDRGERWLAAQIMLLCLAVVAPQWEGPWPSAYRRAGRWVGGPIALLGVLLVVTGSVRLGTNLTPLPRPKANGQLVQNGIYGVVRHPIYSGVIAVLFGSSLLTGRLSRLALALAAVSFFDAKARREEAWLMEQFPDYAAYRRRVKKLIPGLY